MEFFDYGRGDMDITVSDQKTSITGTQISYLFICPTKLWYFSHHLHMEHSSDLVAAGRFIHESSYRREKKDIQIDGIAIDFIRKGDGIELHEVKKSPKMEKSHEMQTLYYIYVLKKKGITATAVIDYPLLRQRKRLELDAEKEADIEQAVAQVGKITALQAPPKPERKRFCPKYSYYDLCWSE